MKVKNSPIIIVGMHRSGTTMISRFVQDMGFFFGCANNLDINNEPYYMININNWILNRLGAAWDNPIPVKKLYEQENAIMLSEIIKTVSDNFYSPMSLKYWGLKSVFFTYEHWGWKEPRTTLLIPVWSNLFPNARFIYVYRNGVDVAKSLCVRKAKIDNMISNKKELALKRKVKGWMLKNTYFSQTIRCSSMKDSFNLYLEYLDVWKSNKELIDPSRVLEVKYESFLENPDENINNIFKFLGDGAKRPSQSMIDTVNSGRAYSYKKDFVSQQFIEKNKGLIKKDYLYDYELVST